MTISLPPPNESGLHSSPYGLYVVKRYTSVCSHPLSQTSRINGYCEQTQLNEFRIHYTLNKTISETVRRNKSQYRLQARSIVEKT